jgi:hypothetical protein
MKNFAIEIISKKPKKIEGLSSHIGRITIGNFQERFYIPLDSWDLEEYRKQWKNGLEKIKTDNASCLVATVQNLLFHPLVFTWALYKEEETVYFHNHIFNKKIAKRLKIDIDFFNLTSENYEQLIRKSRKIITEDGDLISSWNIDYKAVEEFAKNFEP